MKQVAQIFGIILIIFLSCKKTERSITLPSPLPPSPNHTLIANAGSDQIIYLPVAYTKLSGTLSSSPNGVIVSYLWSQVSGPNQSTIANPNSQETILSALVEGTYNFRLQIKDNLGATANDTVVVNIKQGTPLAIANTKLTLIGKPSQWRIATAAGTAGSKVVFAGGLSVDFNGDINHVYSRVDIYDYVSKSWSTAELSQARYNIAVASAGNKIFFAGGSTLSGVISTRVDIYDVAANSWSTAELTQPRANIAAASAGDKILFAGGGDANPWDYNGNSDRVDIYEVSSNTWSTAKLSIPRGGIKAATTGNKILFAGGWSNNQTSDQIDIYDVITNKWSTARLSEAAEVTGATTIGNKVFFVKSFGGLGDPIYSKQVDIYDANTGNLVVESLIIYDWLSQYAETFAGAFTVKNFGVFFPSSILMQQLIVYDATLQKWEITANMGQTFGWEAGIVSANNEIYAANENGVWSIQF